MMMSWNANTFRINGPLCRQSTFYRWISQTKNKSDGIFVITLIRPLSISVEGEMRHLGPVSLRLVKTLRYDNSSKFFNTSNNAHFAAYRFKILCEISKGTFEFSHKILNPYATKYAFTDFNFRVWLTISLDYDFLSLSEMGPWALIWHYCNLFTWKLIITLYLM